MTLQEKIAAKKLRDKLGNLKTYLKTYGKLPILNSYSTGRLKSINKYVDSNINFIESKLLTGESFDLNKVLSNNEIIQDDIKDIYKEENLEDYRERIKDFENELTEVDMKKVEVNIVPGNDLKEIHLLVYMLENTYRNYDHPTLI